MTLNSADFQSRRAMEDFANGKAAVAFLTVPLPRDLTDEQAITLDDGTNPAVEFRIDEDGGGVGGGATAIDVSAVGAEDKDALATAFANAINGVGGGLAITATAADSKIKLENDAAGSAGNTAIVQGAGGATLPSGLPVKFGGDTEFAGGADAVVTTDIIRILKDGATWILFWST